MYVCVSCIRAERVKTKKESEKKRGPEQDSNLSERNALR